MTKEAKIQKAQNKIDLKKSWNVNFWCEELNLRAEELKAIVQKVGNSAHDVRLYITKQCLVSWPSTY